ncbi:NAD-dependent succinate-semialdehyde dehydrogenase [Mesorhizobium sp. B3-1-3]|nr:NAD-dependent succinate-semialdehyde dehydrogenase [Mesorhizobium sp. B3-1-8]TPI70600.1 NAD-dependent succinate-semialdehyde dehydrogenase [Mesorhizobium sp. B3-1-3]
MDYPDVLLYIDGRWTPSRDGQFVPVVNPATQAVVGRVAQAGTMDLDAALAAAQKGIASWGAISPFERCKLMRRAADIFRQQTEEAARLLTLEQGKPLAEARAEALAASDLIEWFAEEGRRAYGRVIPPRIGNVMQFTVKEPVGPVAAFTPWNFPINQVVRKLSAALAAGCSIILKGSEETPASAAKLVAAFAEAGIPDGVVNLVYGIPSEISSYLIPNEVIRKISFTGSTQVGKQIAGLAGQHMKRATMELGGHAPVIVLPDADIGKAAKTMAFFKFRNAGQACISPTRFLVSEPVYDEFVERFVAEARALKMGDGMAEGTTMGPLISERRVEAISSLVQDAVQAGAELVTGGRRPTNAGYFFEPTVLSRVPITARAMNEEPFGPVALMSPVDNLDAAIAESNRLGFGLAAYGFTGSAASAGRMSREIRAGMVSINHQGLSLPEVPFGGINESGHGTEGGADALEPYHNTRFVTHLQAS